LRVSKNMLSEVRLAGKEWRVFDSGRALKLSGKELFMLNESNGS